MSFLVVVVLPAVGMFAFTFLLFRYFMHVRHLSKPYLDPIVGIAPDRRVTLSGVIEPGGPLIPSPLKGDPDVVAWSWHWRGRGANYGRRLDRWSPFTLVRSDGSRVHVERLLSFDPRLSRMTIVHEDRMTDQELHHLRRQQRASRVQSKQIISWIVKSEDEYTPRPEDYELPYDPGPEKRYGLTVLRPGDHVTMPTTIELMSVDADGTPRVFLSPSYMYPFPYRQARSPFHGQGLVVLAGSLFMAAVVFFTIMPMWATNSRLRW